MLTAPVRDDADPAAPVAPVDPAAFAAGMARCGPWEAKPRLAVAVSGGPDSMALALLADSWVRERGGSVLALTVDHGLRPESAAEAEQVRRWLTGRGIAHRILHWQAPRAGAGLQAAARAARYALLSDQCRGEGILHLLLAHHRGDQAETAALRADRASGPDGIAAMALVRETLGVRMVRPLLAVDPAVLRATLAARGQAWIDDPSNRDRRFARVRLRLDGRAGAGEADRARSAGLARAAAERRTATLAARTVLVDPAGFALVDPAAFGPESGPAADRSRLLEGLLRMIGGAAYPTRSDRAGRALEALAAGLALPRTIAGCRLVRWHGRILVCREPAATGPPALFDAFGTARWDDRCTLRSAGASPEWRVEALGEGQRRRLGAAAADLPAPALPTLAAVRSEGDLLAVPSLGWRARADLPQFVIAFAPREPLVGGPFAVV